MTKLYSTAEELTFPFALVAALMLLGVCSIVGAAILLVVALVQGLYNGVRAGIELLVAKRLKETKISRTQPWPLPPDKLERRTVPSGLDPNSKPPVLTQSDLNRVAGEAEERASDGL